MRRTILKTFVASALLFAATPSLFAQNDPTAEIVDIAKLDRSMTRHKAKIRHFKNKEEFKRNRLHQRKHTNKRHSPMIKGVHENAMHPMRNGRSYRYGEYDYRDNNRGYEEPPFPMHPMVYGKPHRYTTRGWVLAYRYDRAEFYDREGFHYGYFNRYGYMFEGEFYRYDRYYTYRDRIKGRGLFDRYFYAPAQWRYYGFCR